MPENLEERFTRSDRDTIIRLSEKQDATIKAIDELKQNIKEIKDNTLSRVERLAIDKADKKEMDCVISDIENLKRYKSWIIGVGSTAIMLIGIIASLITYIYFSDLNQLKVLLEHHIDQTSSLK